MPAIYNLHKRHGQSSGFQDLIFDLKMLRFSESLMLLGKSSHIFGPRKDIVSEILFISNVDFFSKIVRHISFFKNTVNKFRG